MIMTEIWKPIRRFPNYEASNLGRIRTTSGKLSHKILQHKYEHVSVHRYRKTKRCHYIIPVHHLILETFVGPKPKGYYTNHRNGIKSDNRVSNLEWVTPKENVHHAFRTGLMNVDLGLKKGDLKTIRMLCKNRIPVWMIADQFKVSVGTIYNIKKYIHWLES